MVKANPPTINLEFNGGTLVIRTTEAVYNIRMSGGGHPALPAPEAVMEEEAPRPVAIPAPPPAAAPAPAPAAPPDDWLVNDLPEMHGDSALGEAYYSQLSQEMYRAVGSMARRLSMSIHDVEQRQLESFDLEEAGDQLEQAKDQLENVVKMTEQATMRIIDLGEDIQSAADKARGIMEKLAEAPKDESAASSIVQAREQLGQVLEALQGYVAGLGGEPMAPLLERAAQLKAALEGGGQAAAPAAQPEAPQAGPELLWEFPLDLVFQTIYEMCTNETVKKHIKAMWDAGPKGFQPDVVNRVLNQIAPKKADEDNFLNLNLKEVLKSLFNATEVDKFKQILKKMAGTADQIFLDPALPLEAMPYKGEQPAPQAAPQAAAPASTGPAPEAMQKAQELLAEAEQLGARLTPPELPDDLSELLTRATAHINGECLEPENHSALDEVMNIIFDSVNSIIEALSFQDLSGQAIYRIVRLLTDFQVQLLAMVVSFGIKLKAKAERSDLTVDESDRMAQEEVDKVMESLGVPEPGESDQEPSKLDQDSVNNILDSLGF